MPRVNTRTKSRAGREYRCGRCGQTIQPGEKYYRWSFRYGGTRTNCHLHYPRQSELTQSKMGEVYSAVENAQDNLPNAETVQDVVTLVEEVAEVAEQVQQEYAEAAEAFNNGGPNQQMADELEGWVSELQNFSPSEGPDDVLDDEALRAVAERKAVHAEIPPHMEDEYPDWESVSEDPVVRLNLMAELDVALDDDFEGKVETIVEELAEAQTAPVENARSEADDLLNSCPL